MTLRDNATATVAVGQCTNGNNYSLASSRLAAAVALVYIGGFMGADPVTIYVALQLGKKLQPFSFSRFVACSTTYPPTVRQSDDPALHLIPCRWLWHCVCRSVCGPPGPLTSFRRQPNVVWEQSHYTWWNWLCRGWNSSTTYVTHVARHMAARTIRIEGIVYSHGIGYGQRSAQSARYPPLVYYTKTCLEPDLIPDSTPLEHLGDAQRDDNRIALERMRQPVHNIGLPWKCWDRLHKL